MYEKKTFIPFSHAFKSDEGIQSEVTPFIIFSAWCKTYKFIKTVSIETLLHYLISGIPNNVIHGVMNNYDYVHSLSHCKREKIEYNFWPQQYLNP